jgi:hypothetical protein
MLARFIDVSEWGPEEWLAASILAFIVVTVIIVAYRIVTLFQMTRRKKYQPNLRPLRRGRR